MGNLFWVLSLPETSGVWLGLYAQALLRQSALALWPPRVIVLAWIVYLWCQAPKRPGGWGTLLRYGGTVLMVLLLFWPEVLSVGGGRITDATQVLSYAASQDPQAERITAADSGLVEPSKQVPVLVPVGMSWLLKGWTDLWLTLARTLNNQTHRTFSNLLPMQWFLGTEVTTDVRAMMQDWVHHCYLPILSTMEMREARTSRDFDPWREEGALGQALRTREVQPGTQIGRQMSFLSPPESGQLLRCDLYLAALEGVVQRQLYEARTPNGTPLSQVFQEELGADMIGQARWMLLLEMRRASGPAVPAPSLLGQYLGLRGASVAVDAGRGALMGRAGGAWGALVGGLVGSLRGVSGELDHLLNGVSWIVRIALLATWYVPYIVGELLFVVLKLLPVVLLLALMFQRTALLLGSYIMLIGFLTSSPVWFALVDQFSKLAAGMPPQIGEGWDAAVLGALTHSAWLATITALGMLIVPLVMSTLLLGTAAYGAYRGVSTLWRGGM